MATLDANLHGSFEDCTRQNFEDVFDKLNMWFMSHHLTYCLDGDAETNPLNKRLPEDVPRPTRPTAPEHTTPPPKPRSNARSSRSARSSSESTNNIVADAKSEDAANEAVIYDRAQKKYRDALEVWKYETTIWKEDQAKIERITKERVKWTSDREVCYVALYKFLSVPYQHEVDQFKQGLPADELQQFDYTALLGFAKAHYAQGKGLDRFNSVLQLMDFAPARGETHEKFHLIIIVI
jgi:vacuolar-type H+-ATPase subunit H